MKRVLSMLLCICMCLALLPVSALAAELDDIVIIDMEEAAEETAQVEADQEGLIRIDDSVRRPDDAQTVQVTYINPIYRDVLTEDMLAKAPAQATADTMATSSTVYNGLEAAAVPVRTAMVNRESSINFTVRLNSISEMSLDKLVALATVHTGVGKQGDYLYLNWGGMSGSYSYWTESGKTIVEASLTSTYYTTAAQEKTMDSRVSSVLKSLNLTGKTDYAKLCAIYDYITSHVSYDNANLNDSSYTLKYSAYAALINGTAVCQGYSTLLYRMLLDSGVECRSITGGNHAWNIVRIGAWYYNVDSTWDRTYWEYDLSYQYFLRTDANFSDHTREANSHEDYTSSAFYTQHPMASVDYGKAGPKGWVKVKGDWFFYYNNGTVCANGWAKDNTGWCWMNASGKITKDKWIQDGGEWYYLKPNGYMAANEWAKDSAGWLYMNASGKILRNGWAKDSKGWCWMAANGRITKNAWIKSGGEWYFIKADGYMAANAWAKDSNGWCYMGADGKMLKNQWKKDGGYWYFLKSNGYMAANTTLNINGRSYHFDASGHCTNP